MLRCLIFAILVWVAGSSAEASDVVQNPTGPQTTGSQILTTKANLQSGTTFAGPSPWYDITNSAYGAACNGSTDDTSAIQSALTAAQNAGGGQVYVPAGTSGPCVVASSLNMNGFKNVTRPGRPFRFVTRPMDAVRRAHFNSQVTQRGS